MSGICDAALFWVGVEQVACLLSFADLHSKRNCAQEAFYRRL